MRLKAEKKKHLPFGNASSAGERRAHHALLGSWGSDSLSMTFPKMLLPTALCNAAYTSGSNRGCAADFSSEKILGCVMRNVHVIVSMPANVIAFGLEYTML